MALSSSSIAVGKTTVANQELVIAAPDVGEQVVVRDVRLANGGVVSSSAILYVRNKADGNADCAVMWVGLAAGEVRSLEDAYLVIPPHLELRLWAQLPGVSIVASGHYFTGLPS